MSEINLAASILIGVALVMFCLLLIGTTKGE